MLRQFKPSVTAGVDFVPVGALRHNLDRLAKEFGFRIENESDDLGPVRCAYLETEDGHRFLLRRYASYPDEMVDLFVPSQLPDYQEVLDNIAGELRMQRDEIIPGTGKCQPS